jgi:hypothetical protein
MSLTALIFLAVYGLLLALAFLRRPYWGLLAYMWAFYNHPEARWWGEQVPALRYSLIAAVVTLLAIGVSRQPASASRPEL